MTLNYIMEKAMPRPWDINIGQEGAVVFNAGQGTVCNLSDEMRAFKENAALIAHCVNNFGQLVDALEAVRREASKSERTDLLEIVEPALAAAQTVEPLAKYTPKIKPLALYWNDLSLDEKLRAIHISKKHEDELADGGYLFNGDCEIIPEEDLNQFEIK